MEEYSWLRYGLLIILLPFVRVILDYRSEEDNREYQKIERAISPLQSTSAQLYFLAYLVGLMVCGVIAIQPYLGTSLVLPFLSDFSLAYTKLTIGIELALGLMVLTKRTTYKINTLAAAKYGNCSTFYVRYACMLGPMLYCASQLFSLL